MFASSQLVPSYSLAKGEIRYPPEDRSLRRYRERRLGDFVYRMVDLRPGLATPAFVDNLKTNEQVLDYRNRGELWMRAGHDPDFPYTGIVARMAPNPKALTNSSQPPIDEDFAQYSINYRLIPGRPKSMLALLTDKDLGIGPPDTIVLFTVSRWEDKERPERNAKGGGAEFIANSVSHVCLAAANEGIHIKEAITHSPAFNLRKWLHKMPEADRAEADRLVNRETYSFDMDGLRARLAPMKNIRDLQKDPEVMAALEQLTFLHITRGRFVAKKSDASNGAAEEKEFSASCPTARFHCGNGARIAQICIASSNREDAWDQSYGTNVGYEYRMLERPDADDNLIDLAVANAQATSYRQGQFAHDLHHLAQPRQRPRQRVIGQVTAFVRAHAPFRGARTATAG